MTLRLASHRARSSVGGAAAIKARERHESNAAASRDHRVEIPHHSDFEVTPVYLKKNILEAVRHLFGEEGANSQIDILKFSPKTCRFVARCPSSDYIRLRAALTAATRYEGETCMYTVHRATPNLLSLTADSRTHKHGESPTKVSSCR